MTPARYLWTPKGLMHDPQGSLVLFVEYDTLLARVAALEKENLTLGGDDSLAMACMKADLRDSTKKAQLAKVEELQKAKSSIYKDKHAYQWHDEYMATLKAWHEEVDGLKAQLTTMEEKQRQLDTCHGIISAQEATILIMESRLETQLHNINKYTREADAEVSVAKRQLVESHEQWTKTNAQYEQAAKAVTRMTGELVEAQATIERLEHDKRQ